MNTNEGKALAALKPCPFCGGEAEFVFAPYSKRGAIRCSVCLSEARENVEGNARGVWENAEDAIAIWNRRAIKSQFTDGHGVEEIADALESASKVPMDRIEWERLAVAALESQPVAGQVIGEAGFVEDVKCPFCGARTWLIPIWNTSKRKSFQILRCDGCGAESPRRAIDFDMTKAFALRAAQQPQAPAVVVDVDVWVMSPDEAVDRMASAFAHLECQPPLIDMHAAAHAILDDVREQVSALLTSKVGR